jgi:hypothetical protein
MSQYVWHSLSVTVCMALSRCDQKKVTIETLLTHERVDSASWMYFLFIFIL